MRIFMQGWGAAACAVGLAVGAVGASEAMADPASVTTGGVKFSAQFPCAVGQAETKMIETVAGAVTAKVMACETGRERYSMMIAEYPIAMKILSPDSLLDNYVNGMHVEQQNEMKENTSTKFDAYPARRAVFRYKIQPPMDLVGKHVAVNGMTVSIMSFTVPELVETPKVTGFLGSLKIETGQ